MRQCNQCLVESSGKEPEIDSAGVCSYCRTIEEFGPTVSSIGQRPELLYERLNRATGRGSHDCVVGFSGGKDSSYVIYNLQSRYGARVMTFTLDNGFMAAYGKDNINRLVKDLDLDHRWVRPDDTVLRAMHSRSLLDFGWPCSSCFHMIEAATWKIAYENRIPYIVHGRIPEQILRTPNAESFAFPYSLIGDNLAPYDHHRTRELAMRTLQRFEVNKRWLLPRRKSRAKATESLYLPDNFVIPDDFAPEVLGFFVYEDYDEHRIMDSLEKETSWVRPEHTGPLSHADCLAHEAAGHLYYRLHNRQFYALEISALVRHGKMSRQEGAEILRTALPGVMAYPQESMKHLSRVAGISERRLRALPSWIRLKNGVKGSIEKILGRR